MQLYYLSQRKDSPIWYAALRDSISGKIGTKRSTGTTLKKEAEHIVQLWLRDGLPQTDKESCDTFTSFLENFWDIDNSKYFKELETMGKTISKRHAKDMQQVIRRYYNAYWGKKRLRDIDEIQLQDFLVWLRTVRKLSSSTVNQARNAAFVAIRFAKRHRFIKSFDFDMVLRCSGKSKVRGILEREEVEKIFLTEWRDERSKLVNFIASKTGMRMGEIRALRVADILLDRIIIRHSWSRVDGGLKCTKNGEEREVPLISVLNDAICNYLEDKPFAFTPTAFLFPSEVEGVPYDEKQIVEDFYKVLRQIGINEEDRRSRNIVFHGWRHYCAKNLSAVTTKSIGMKILGHKTSAMFDHYADHIDRELFNAMQVALRDGLGEKNIEDSIQFPIAKSV